MIRAWMTIAAALLNLAGGEIARAEARPVVPPADKADIVVLISANAEWKPARQKLAALAFSTTPFGECAAGTIEAGGRKRSVVYVHGGWGKISAAASA